ncbi:hypothetical protein [Priestia megaterium]|uniref:hypothetical protein n=1 Tax=Priestia megaterium TaxID=1404 RepID=UPI0035A8A140
MPSNHQLEATQWIKPYQRKNPNELDFLSRISIHRSDLASTVMLLFQPLFY